MRRITPTRLPPNDVIEGRDTEQPIYESDRVRTGNAFVDGYSVVDRPDRRVVGDDSFMGRPLFQGTVRPYD